jgi:hypothetical protein
MTTLTRTKTLNRRLFILSAGLLLQAHNVFASDSIGDAQAQARAFLDPAVVHHATNVEALATTQANNRVERRADAQELARALLLGKSTADSAAQSPAARSFAGKGTPSDSAQNRHAYSDPQEVARRMILGNGARPVVAHSIAEDWAARPTVGGSSPR